MNFDDFENELRRQPVRPPPPGWRDEILTAVEKQRSTASEQAVDPAVPATGFPLRWRTQWREWLWPCPQAWMGLAAVWLILLSLNSPPGSRGRAMAGNGSVTPNPEELQKVAAQRRELARLLDLPVDPLPPKAPAPLRPRSESSSVPKA